MDRLIAWVKGSDLGQDEWPLCPDHDVPMNLVKKIGKPARYHDQENETYVLLYRCPFPGCDNSATRTRVRSQIPVPGEAVERPDWTPHDRTSV